LADFTYNDPLTAHGAILTTIDGSGNAVVTELGRDVSITVTVGRGRPAPVELYNGTSATDATAAVSSQMLVDGMSA
jgi:hypothetical protein